MIDEAIAELTPLVGVCSARRARARHYRRHRKSPAPSRPEPMPAPQPRALSEVERKEVRAVLNSDEHVDEAPATVDAKLLDEGTYLASVSTMYQILGEHGEVGDRRRHATHPARAKPELFATAPDQVFAWDITKLHGPTKWSYFYLYTVIDIFSRYVPGWMRAHERTPSSPRHSSRRRSEPRHRTGPTHDPLRSRLADDREARRAPARGSRRDQEPQPAALLERQPPHRKPLPHAQVPAGLPEELRLLRGRARSLRPFLPLYNEEHRHSGIGFHTPADVHYGRAELVHSQRAEVLSAA